MGYLFWKFFVNFANKLQTVFYGEGVNEYQYKSN